MYAGLRQWWYDDAPRDAYRGPVARRRAGGVRHDDDRPAGSAHLARRTRRLALPRLTRHGGRSKAPDPAPR
jgi:hypothetical protein